MNDIKETNTLVYKFVENSIDRISGQFDLSALQKGMSNFEDEELRLTAMMQGSTRGDLWPLAIALANTELDRRSQEVVERLARKTTRWSVGVGAVATILGGTIGAIATLLVS